MSAEKTMLSPVRLGAYELPNRIVMAPLTRNRAGAGNVPGPLNATYYEQRASAGLIVTEATQISPQGVGYPSTPGIHSPEQMEGWRLVTCGTSGAFPTPPCNQKERCPLLPARSPLKERPLPTAAPSRLSLPVHWRLKKSLALSRTTGKRLKMPSKQVLMG
jgi:hypothetical protein